MELPQVNRTLPARSLLFVVLLFHFGAATIGWNNLNLPGVEFRQAQTAISAFFIQKEGNFSLAYPTPVLGKPWSIPMEFPLYQWATVVWSNVTGAPLTQSGRTISLLCFYLSLPAIWMFLRRLGLTSEQSSFALVPVLLCPIYIFYSRAFLIETMALMFSIWFAVAYVETVKRRSWLGFIIVAISGALAGAIKVTTLILFLIPCAIWSAAILIRARRRQDWSDARRILSWGMGSVILPGLATVGWTQYADGVKSGHPQGSVLMSGSMNQFNFGYGVFDVRFSAETWRSIHQIINEGIISPWILGLFLILGSIWSGQWRRAALAAFGLFIIAPVIFPLLYAWHDYYFVASSAFLMLAIGFVLAGLSEKKWGTYAAVALVGVIGWSQWETYRNHYHPLQSAVGRNGPKISFTIRELTEAENSIVIVGDDWNSMIPYYAQRKALMIRRTFENDLPLIKRCLVNLEDEVVGVVVLMGEQIENHDLLGLLEKKLGISRHHYFVEDNAHLFPTESRLKSLLPEDVRSSKNASPLNPAYYSISHRFADKILDSSVLNETTSAVFQSVHPTPDQFYFQFGPGLVELETKEVLNAHTLTRMWFDLPPGEHTLKMSGGMMEGAWNRDEDITDGVSLSLRREDPSEASPDLFYHHLNPRVNPEHRGEQSWSTSFYLEAPARVLLEVGPGPAGNGGTDWFYFAEISFE